MINRGTFQTLIDQIAQQAPEQVQQGYALASQLAAFSYADLGLGIAERISAVLFHIGASILVFYACRDRQKRGLYPLAVLLHTCLDFFAALTMTGTLSLSAPVQEGVFGCVGLVTFLLAYFLLYRKDTADFSAAAFDK